MHIFVSRRGRWVLAVLGFVGLIGLAVLGNMILMQPEQKLAPPRAAPLPAPPQTTVWDRYAGDDGATQYSALAQITPANVDQLEVAWTYRTGDMHSQNEGLGGRAFANTPIMADGLLIACTPMNRVIAIDPATGTRRWEYDPHIMMKQESFGKFVCRGVVAWRDSAAADGSLCADRILYGTNDLRIIALDVKTGRLCPGFGDKGQVHVIDQNRKFASEVQFTAPPALVNGVIVLGSAVQDGSRIDAPHGVVRAFDARTGAPRWTFDPIPAADDPAAKSWKNGTAGQGGGNVWADMAVDPALDLVYLPTSSAMIEVEGRTRPGDNQYTNSVVAIRGTTGEVMWSRQLVHHDIWDYDIPAAPLLTDIKVDGKNIPAAIQTTKMGLVYVFDRRDGKPVFPIEERPAPRGDPDQHLSPTQPFPVGMPSLAGERITSKDAFGFTPFDKAWCRNRLAKATVTDLFAAGKKGESVIIYPTASGGSNLGQRAYDPQRRLLIANTIRTALVTNVDGSKKMLSGGGLISPLGAPCIAPPWGLLTALDVETRKIVWQVPLGSIEKLAPIPMPLKYGTPARGGPLVTGGGLIFIAGTMDNAIRAFETDTGRELWKMRLPAGGQATPMTYRGADGRQYIVIAAGGHGWMKTAPGDYLVAYALPR